MALQCRHHSTAWWRHGKWLTPQCLTGNHCTLLICIVALHQQDLPGRAMRHRRDVSPSHAHAAGCRCSLRCTTISESAPHFLGAWASRLPARDRTNCCNVELLHARQLPHGSRCSCHLLPQHPLQPRGQVDDFYQVWLHPIVYIRLSVDPSETHPHYIACWAAMQGMRR
jgi:hypothetical protein